MKLVIAIIKPFKLDAVREALARIGIQGITVTEAKGFGRQKGQGAIYRGGEYESAFLPKLRVEIAIPADHEDAVVEAVSGAARSGKVGDGKIFVIDLSRAVRIRTGESNHAAL